MSSPIFSGFLRQSGFYYLVLFCLLGYLIVEDCDWFWLFEDLLGKVVCSYCFISFFNCLADGVSYVKEVFSFLSILALLVWVFELCGFFLWLRFCLCDEGCLFGSFLGALSCGGCRVFEGMLLLGFRGLRVFV